MLKLGNAGLLLFELLSKVSLAAVIGWPRHLISSSLLAVGSWTAFWA